MMPEKFDVEYFKNQLRTTWLGSEFIYLSKVDSTSTYLKRIPSPDLVHGSVVITDHQMKGRGQYERKWEAEPGRNLTFTIGLRPPSAERLTLLTLACGYAIALVLEEYIPGEVSIKWPNDLYIGDKKIGGLLTECTFFGSKPDRVLIGIGLNTGQNHFSDDVKEKAISLADIADRAFSREQLLCRFLEKTELFYQQWHKHNTELQKQISQKMIGYGEWVRVRINGELRDEKYKFLGVNEKGELLLLNRELDVNTFSYEQIRIITARQGVPEPNR